MRRVLSVLTVIVALLGTYAVGDVTALVPGVLTYDGAAVTPPTDPTTGQPSPRWAPLPSGSPVASVSAPPASKPSAKALESALAAVLADPALGPSVGAVVRDGLSGEVLFSRDGATGRAPASVTKVTSAWAIATGLDMNARMKTAVVTGADAGEMVLVAGGDTMLGEAASNPNVVIGRAGIGTLADQVAASLRSRGVASVTLRVDASYAAGPRWPAKWKLVDAQEGSTQPVAMLGRAVQMPKIGTPSVAVAEDSVAGALAAALRSRGIMVQPVPLQGKGTPAPEGATELGSVQSATYREVLDVALNVSDDALTENLVRQAMAAEGISAEPLTAPPAYVQAALAKAGVDVSGMATLDASGLAYGQFLSAETISQTIALASTGQAPEFREVIAGLPVAGLTGTLSSRYRDRTTSRAAGIARAKTGTLTGISSLAGTTVTADGRLLTFVILADRVPPSSGTLGARAALDRIVTALTDCGCR